jgi:hypothetical protein
MYYGVMVDYVPKSMVPSSCFITKKDNKAFESYSSINFA